MVRRVTNWVTNWLNQRGWYHLDELQAGGRCGCCGKWIADAVVPKYWAVTLCAECIALKRMPDEDEQA